MATTIPFQQVKASTGLKAPDITKAGSLFSKAVSDLASTVEGIGEQRVTDAQNVFQNELRTARETQDFSGVNFDNLNAVGANAQELQAAETSLRNSQLDVLGRQTESNFQNAFTGNDPAVRSAVSNFISNNPKLKDIVTVDTAGTLQFSANPNFTTKQKEFAKDSIARLLQAPDSGFTPIQKPREVALELSKKVRDLGGSKEDSDRLIQNFTAFQNQFTELSPTEKQLVVDSNSRTQLNYEREKQKLLNRKQLVENELGFTSESAAEKLQINEGNIFDFIGKELPEDFDLLLWKGEGGIDAKNYVEQYLNRGTTKDGVPIRPWMLLDALKRTADTSEDSRTFSKGDFDNALEAIAKNPELIDKIRKAAVLDGQYKQNLTTLELQNFEAKIGNLAEIKSQAGIRNAPFNRSIANRNVAEDLSSITTPIINTPATSSIPPQSGVQTLLPNIGGGTPVPQPQSDLTLEGIGFLANDAINATADFIDNNISINPNPNVGARAIPLDAGDIDIETPINLPESPSRAPTRRDTVPLSPAEEVRRAQELEQQQRDLIERRNTETPSNAVQGAINREIQNLPVSSIPVDNSIPDFNELLKRAEDIERAGDTQAIDYKILRAALLGVSVSVIAQSIRRSEDYVNNVLRRQ